MSVATNNQTYFRTSGKDYYKILEIPPNTSAYESEKQESPQKNARDKRGLCYLV